MSKEKSIEVIKQEKDVKRQADRLTAYVKKLEKKK